MSIPCSLVNSSRVPASTANPQYVTLVGLGAWIIRSPFGKIKVLYGMSFLLCMDFRCKNTIILIVVTEKIQIFAGILIFFATDCTGCSWPFAVLYKLRYYE